MADNSQTQDYSSSLQEGLAQLNYGINTFTTTASTERGRRKDYEYWQKSVDYQNKLAQQNYERQLNDNYNWALNSKTMEVSALRNAGLNPAWSQDGAGNISASSSAPSAPDAPSGVYDNAGSQNGMQYFMRTMQAQQMMLNTEMQKAQIETLRTNNAKTEAETEGINRTNLGNAEADKFSTLVHNQKVLWDPTTGSFYTTDENDNPVIINFKDKPKTKEGQEAMLSFEKHLSEASVYQSLNTENRLKSIVGTLQINDGAILNALANTPQEVLNNIKADVTSKELDNEVKKIQKKVWRKLGELDDERLQILGAILLNYAKQ